MMMNRVANILLEKGIDFIPNHTSFYITESNIEAVREIIFSKFYNKRLLISCYILLYSYENTLNTL